MTGDVVRGAVGGSTAGVLWGRGRARRARACQPPRQAPVLLPRCSRFSEEISSETACFCCWQWSAVVFLILGLVGVNWFSAASHANPALAGTVPKFDRSGLWDGCYAPPKDVAAGLSAAFAAGAGDDVAPGAAAVASMAPAFAQFYGDVWSICNTSAAFTLFEDMWGNDLKPQLYAMQVLGICGLAFTGVLLLSVAVNTNTVVAWREEPSAWRHVNWLWLTLQLGSVWTTFALLVDAVYKAKDDSPFPSWNNASEYFGSSFWLWTTGAILATCGAFPAGDLVARSTRRGFRRAAEEPGAGAGQP